MGMDGGLYGKGWRVVCEWMEDSMGKDGGLYGYGCMDGVQKER